MMFVFLLFLLVAINPPSMDLFACRGIQHPKLASISNEDGNDDVLRSYCREKWTYLGGGWRSNDCLLVVGPGASKQRCLSVTLKIIDGGYQY